MSQYLFILGADDPEMTAIEAVLKGKGIPYGYARFGGTRVHPGNAYKAEAWTLPDPTSNSIPLYDCKVMVECSISGILPDVVVDHHNEGDPGHAVGPADFWQGSSLGQVCTLLGVDPTPEMLLTAASDHCPAHAYKGMCPGIDPDQLAAFRAKRSAAFKKIEPEVLMSRINGTMNLIRRRVQAGEVLPHFLPDEAPELPEASLRLGRPVSYELPDRDGRMKVGVLNGDFNLLTEWMTVIAPSLGLVDIYGSPTRGYAGAYRP